MFVGLSRGNSVLSASRPSLEQHGATVALAPWDPWIVIKGGLSLVYRKDGYGGEQGERPWRGAVECRMRRWCAC